MKNVANIMISVALPEGVDAELLKTKVEQMLVASQEAHEDNFPVGDNVPAVTVFLDLDDQQKTKLEVGKKYFLESSENHPTGLKWDFLEFEVIRIDEGFPLSVLVEEADAELEFAIIRGIKSVDLSMSNPEDANLPVEVKDKNELLILTRKTGESWYCAWWAQEADVQEFVDRTPTEWMRLKQEYASSLINKAAN